MTRFGPDVSDWQEGVDWRAVASAGHTFGVTKATEGTRNVQATLARNRSEMAGAGLEAIGLYHFARPEDGNPSTQAAHFLAAIDYLREREFAVLDVETGEPGSWPGFIAGWCSLVEDVTGRRPVVYMSESPAGSMPAACARWPLWVAGYVGRFPTEWADPRLTAVGPWAAPVMWQFTSGARVAGIAGECDLNIAPDDLPARLGLVVGDVRPAPSSSAEASPIETLRGRTVDHLRSYAIPAGDMWVTDGTTKWRVPGPAQADLLAALGIKRDDRWAGLHDSLR